MTLRTAALVAGALGVLLLIAGLIADAQRPPADIEAEATLDTAVVVYSPEMVAFAGDNTLGVDGEGDVVALTARPVDADAWLAERDATEVTGLPEWETLSTAPYEVAEPEPTASPSVSPSASPSPEPSPSVSPSGEEAEPVDILALTSSDHWREQWSGVDRVAVPAAQVPPGETLVVVSRDGSPLAATDMTLSREVNDGWITPLIWWGVALTVVGLIALILRFIDTRPWQARAEKWRVGRHGATDDVDPGSRRALRASGDPLPDVTLDHPADNPPATPASPPSTPENPHDQGGRA
ncbi:hypothetical protein [Demequina sediminicola]|uniref:hypothetical protein n=1 Tax=Demequina sediminicola TaxID=1095026 RepID=UPI000A6CBA55|nr:hypothetical protein [Demequina sediminicola]